jgi:hypothetical protein
MLFGHTCAEEIPPRTSLPTHPHSGTKFYAQHKTETLGSNQYRPYRTWQAINTSLCSDMDPATFGMGLHSDSSVPRTSIRGDILGPELLYKSRGTQMSSTLPSSSNKTLPLKTPLNF